jgi:hypothetical protein
VSGLGAIARGRGRPATGHRPACDKGGVRPSIHVLIAWRLLGQLGFALCKRLVMRS